MKTQLSFKEKNEYELFYKVPAENNSVCRTFGPIVPLWNASSTYPTNTFQVGFWFNNLQDAAACGFDPTKPTPFNGEHKAGPLAMISLLDAATGLGPLCTNPSLSTSPASCNPYLPMESSRGRKAGLLSGAETGYATCAFFVILTALAAYVVIAYPQREVIS